MHPLHTFRRGIVIAALVIGSSAPLASAQTSVPSGSLIKGTTSSSVYYVEAGKRYAFPNEAVFKSWYADFSTVIAIPDSDLAAYTLAANVTYRPGSRLVKVTTDPKVYAVSQYGILRWVMTEAAAAQLYGSDWNTKVDDVADTFFTNYLVGSNIGAGADYNLNEESSVTAISQNIRPGGYVAPTLPTTPPSTSSNAATISVVVSTSQATLNQMVLVFAQVANSSKPIVKIEMYNDGQTAPTATCLNSTSCSFLYTVTQAPELLRFWAVATDSEGTRIKTATDQEGSLNVASVSTDIQMGVTPLEVTAGSRVSYTSNASKFASITSHQVFIVIPGEPNPVLWQDCGINSHCDSSSPIYRTSQFFSKVTTGGQTYQSASVTVKVTGGTPPKPTLTLVSKPQANQAVLKLDAPSGETIGWSTIVEGTGPDDNAIALCEFSSCEITVQFSKTTTYTGFTDVGGKLEGSNNITVGP